MQDILITVVDFGSKKLSVSLGKSRGTEVEIIASQNVPSKGGIKKGIVEDVNICKNSLVEVLKKLEWLSGEKVDGIYAGISSKNLRIIEGDGEVALKEGMVREEDKKNVIEDAKENLSLGEGEEIVDTLVNFYTLDGRRIDEEIDGSLGNNLKVNITLVLGLQNELDKYRKIVKEAGYQFNGFVVNIIGGKNIFLYDDKSNGIHAIVDIGAEITDIAVFNNGILKYISSIPLGGENITKDLSICGKYSLIEAENLKNIYSKNYESMYNDTATNDIIEAGSTKVSKKLFYEVIQARLDEIIKYINLEIKKTSFYEGICSIIIYGDGLVNYENVISVINKSIKKKCKVVTKAKLGMQDLADISSLAGVKEVYDRLNLIDEEKIEIEKSKEEYNNNYVEETKEEYEEDKKPKGFIQKIKKFLVGKN
ncbi:MAG: cell division protein FtsA [Clostridium sp.]|nr:cell division protein FtsA [Clostridium sp.]